MNNEALNYAYDLFSKDGYNGTVEDFNSLLSTNDEAVNYAYSLFQKNGYKDTIDDFKNVIKSQDDITYSVLNENISISKQEIDDIISRADAAPVKKTKKGEIEQKQFNPYAKGYGAYVAPRKDVEYESYVFDEFLNEDRSNIEEAKQQWISKQRKELLQVKLEESL